MPRNPVNTCLAQRERPNKTADNIGMCRNHHSLRRSGRTNRDAVLMLLPVFIGKRLWAERLGPDNAIDFRTSAPSPFRRGPGGAPIARQPGTHERPLQYDLIKLLV